MAEAYIDVPVEIEGEEVGTAIVAADGAVFVNLTGRWAKRFVKAFELGKANDFLVSVQLHANIGCCEVDDDRDGPLWCASHQGYMTHCGLDGDSRICSLSAYIRGCNCCSEERRDEL